MCSLSSTLRFCCVGPAPFDDIADVPYHDKAGPPGTGTGTGTGMGTGTVRLRRCTSQDVPKVMTWTSHLGKEKSGDGSSSSTRIADPSSKAGWDKTEDVPSFSYMAGQDVPRSGLTSSRQETEQSASSPRLDCDEPEEGLSSPGTSAVNATGNARPSSRAGWGHTSDCFSSKASNRADLDKRGDGGVSHPFSTSETLGVYINSSVNTGPASGFEYPSVVEVDVEVEDIGGQPVNINNNASTGDADEESSCANGCMQGECRGADHHSSLHNRIKSYSDDQQRCRHLVKRRSGKLTNTQQLLNNHRDDVNNANIHDRQLRSGGGAGGGGGRPTPRPDTPRPLLILRNDTTTAGGDYGDRPGNPAVLARQRDVVMYGGRNPCHVPGASFLRGAKKNEERKNLHDQERRHHGGHHPDQLTNLHGHRPDQERNLHHGHRPDQERNLHHGDHYHDEESDLHGHTPEQERNLHGHTPEQERNLHGHTSEQERNLHHGHTPEQERNLHHGHTYGEQSNLPRGQGGSQGISSSSGSGGRRCASCIKRGLRMTCSCLMSSKTRGCTGPKPRYPSTSLEFRPLDTLSTPPPRPFGPPKAAWEDCSAAEATSVM